MSNNEFSTPKLTPMDGVKFPSVSPTEDSGYILSQEFKEYATLEVNERIDAIAGGIIPKGDILSTDLPTASEENVGWMYYLTDLGYKVISDGTQWVQFSDNMVTQTITDGDTAHAPSSDAVYDALQERVAAEEDLQNQIVNLNTDVATLDAIVGCEAEIENTDPSEGQSILSSSRLIHHVNLLPSGGFGLVGARDVKWNQLVQNGNFADNTLWMPLHGSLSVSSNIATVTATSTSTEVGIYGDTGNKHNVYSGHKYLICVDFKYTSACTLKLSYGGGNQQNVSYTTPNAFQRMCAIWTSSSDDIRSVYALVAESVSSGSSMQFRNCVSRDLTAIFGSGNEPTSVANVPAWMLSYTAYDEGSIVNLNPTAFSVRGVNLWDEEYKLGNYNDSTGEYQNAGNYVVSKNPIRIEPNHTYYCNKLLRKFYYTADMTYISNTGNLDGQFTTPSDAFYMNIRVHEEIGSYNNDVQICDNSLPSSLKTVYHPYSEQTVPVSISGHYVNENVYDYVTNKTVDGVLRGEVHTKVGAVDLGDLTWTHSGAVTHLFYTQLSDSKTYPINTDIDGIIGSSVYNLVASKNAVSIADKEVTFTPNTTYLYLFDSTKDGSDLTDGHASWLEDIILQYALASETVTYTEPLRSFSVSDYCTIEPITPQTLPNRVDVPFSILSNSNNGLIEQIRTNTADIADNKQILSQHEARLSNLEQIAGEYASADMQDYSSVPTGKASYALVETMKGVSRVENNIITNGNFENANGWSFVTGGDGSYSVADNIAKIIFGSNNSIFQIYKAGSYLGFSYTSGHSYLVFVKVRLSVNASVRVVQYETNNIHNGSNITVKANQWTLIPLLFTAGASGQFETNVQSIGGMSQGDVIEAKEFVVTDLTQYFNGGTIPTLAEIQSMYPELLEPRSYNAGEIVDSTYSEVRSNWFDGQTELGYYRGSDGASRPSTTELRTVNPITVDGGISYKIEGDGEYASFRWYDASSNYISGDDYASVAVAPSNAKYLKLNFGDNYGTVYKHDIWVYPTNARHTLIIPTVTLKGAGSVSDTLDVESGEITRRAVALDLGDLTWENYNDTNGIFKTIVSGVTNRYGSSSSVAEMTCARYFPDTANRVSSGNTNLTIGLNGGGSTLYVYDSSYAKDASVFTTGVTGIKVILELATPTTDSVTPTLNNTLKTEGGGSVFTDADVDGHFTLGFINL